MGVIKLRRCAYEKPESVSDNWSTNRAAGISVVKAVTRGIDVAQRFRAGALDKRVRLKLRVTVRDLSRERLSRAETACFKLHTEVAVKIVATALGNNVDDAARCTAKLSIKTARLYLHFLYELE